MSLVGTCAWVDLWISFCLFLFCVVLRFLHQFVRTSRDSLWVFRLCWMATSFSWGVFGIFLIRRFSLVFLITIHTFVVLPDTALDSSIWVYYPTLSISFSILPNALENSTIVPEIFTISTFLIQLVSTNIFTAVLPLIHPIAMHHVFFPSPIIYSSITMFI